MEKMLPKKGDKYVHHQTHRVVVVDNNPTEYSYVHLKHVSGKITLKEMHYFLCDYIPLGDLHNPKRLD